MKILWCTHTLAGFIPEKGSYNGSGWITSLLEEFRKIQNIKIGVAFYLDKNSKCVIRDGVTFFPIQQGHVDVLSKFKSFLGDYSGWEHEEKLHMARLKEIIHEFSPDIIHVWGTETDMGLIAKEVDIPVIIHLQGLLQPYENMLCPPGISRFNYICQDGYNPIKIIKNINRLRYWNYKSERESRIFSECKYYFGRTHWDKALSYLFNPKREYYYCSEMLRPEFYTNDMWTIPHDDVLKIISTISPPLYKGADMIIKTAKILKNICHINFEWNVIGIEEMKFVEHSTNIKADEVNVKCLGVKPAEEIKKIELNSHIYFHSSYIDNSPNSICEAQMLGMPVIAVNVGGVATILNNGRTGWLVPSNEPHIAAILIATLFHNKVQLTEKSEATIKISHKRHDKSCIIKSLMQCYEMLIQR